MALYPEFLELYHAILDPPLLEQSDGTMADVQWR